MPGRGAVPRHPATASQRVPRTSEIVIAEATAIPDEMRRAAPTTGAFRRPTRSETGTAMVRLRGLPSGAPAEVWEPVGVTDTDEGHWRSIARQVVHDGRMRLVEHVVELGDGTTTTYEVDESVPFAVATLVFVDGDVILAREYRYPIDQWVLDLPGGAGEADETPAEAARREVEEEIGLVPAELKPLHTFYPNPGRSAWPVHVFLARSVTEGRADATDPSEQVRLERIPLAELDARIVAGEVVDPALLIARFMAAVAGELPAVGSGG